MSMYFWLKTNRIRSMHLYAGRLFNFPVAWRKANHGLDGTCADRGGLFYPEGEIPAVYHGCDLVGCAACVFYIFQDIFKEIA